MIRAIKRSACRLSEGADHCDPVSAWLRARPDLAQGAWHSEAFVFDGSPVLMRSRSADVIDYLRNEVAAYCPNTLSMIGRQPGCSIEIHLIDGQNSGGIVLPDGGWASMSNTFELPLREVKLESEEFVHVRWPGVESFWRPFDLLASLTFSRSPQIRLLVVGSAERDKGAASGSPLRAKANESVAHPGSRAKAGKTERYQVSMVEIADLVRVMAIRAYGHFCLHAATVASGQRGALLMGPSGSGKTTTALALLRGGFEVLSDEFSVLNANLEPVRLTGFKRTPQVVGQAPKTLAELEETLEPGREGKTPFRVFSELDAVAQSQWLRPAAMFFLRIRPGARVHLVNPVCPEEAFVRVTNQVLDPTNVFRREEQAQALIALVEACPAYELILGNNLASLPEVVREVVGGGC